VKTADGDRYEGNSSRDRKEGTGTYAFGRGPWLGERYEGRFLDDRRHGSGVYRWASGDVYSGPWERDIAIGAPHADDAGAHQVRGGSARGRRQGRPEGVPRGAVGIALRDWVRGVVVAVAPDNVAVRIDDPGQVPHILGSAEARPGDVVWDSPQAWTPCW